MPELTGGIESLFTFVPHAPWYAWAVGLAWAISVSALAWIGWIGWR